jgi:DNA polymerase elongation subunit (family B)
MNKEKNTMPEPTLSKPAEIYENYNNSPFTLIKVEVLNGCGEKDVGKQFTDFLRNYHVDVISTKNADHFDFSATQIIQRSEFLDRGYQVASLLGIDEDDIIDDFDLNMELDITVVIGSDFKSIKPFDTYLESRRLN